MKRIHTQSRKDSILEAITNTVASFLLNIGVIVGILPFLGIYMSPIASLEASLILTILHIIKTYLIRRYFNCRTKQEIYRKLYEKH